MSPSSASSSPLGAGGPADPGRDVVESLYRGAPGQPGLLRPYEPSLRPPEGTSDYGWLFRPDQSEVVASALLGSEGSLSLPGQQSLRATTTSGLAAVLPAPPLRLGAAARRWPVAALLAVALLAAHWPVPCCCPGWSAPSEPARSTVTGQESRTSVTGPSLVRLTCMSAPNTPVSTWAPCSRRAATKAATRGSLTGRGAAALQEGRRPLRVSA